MTVISIGDFDGRAAQFWVKGNAPDPASIGEKDGVVKYELRWRQLGSPGQLQKRADADDVQGVALVRVLPNHRLKFAAFPGRTAGQVTGFTAAARFSER